MPDAYNPWGAPVFPTADDNAPRAEPVATSLLSQIAGIAGRAPLFSAQPEMRAAEYTPTQRIGNAVSDALQYLGMQPYTANDLTSRVGHVLMGSPLGIPASAADAVYAKAQGDNLGTVQAMAGMLPGVGPEARAAANEVRQGIRAYHGSPHDFDKFDLSKIGTGEGAQAYGHGLYFADNEGVAKSYRDALAPQSLDGRMVEQLLAKHGSDRTAALADLAQQEASTNNPKYAPMFQGARDMIEGKVPTRPGHMYEVNINADPSHFLDWDRPVSQQSEAVRTALAQKAWADQGATAADLLDVHVPGEQAYKRMVTGQGGTALPGLSRQPQALSASEQLQQAGIPGIKYLDQGSRGAGQGSSNYVVFNHDIIDIMRKYAVPGMLGAPILANALSEQKT